MEIIYCALLSDQGFNLHPECIGSRGRFDKDKHVGVDETLKVFQYIAAHLPSSERSFFLACLFFPKNVVCVDKAEVKKKFRAYKSERLTFSTYVAPHSRRRGVPSS
jgi:hypothetical protein